MCAADGRVTLANPAGQRSLPGVETRTYDDDPRPVRRWQPSRHPRSGRAAGRSSSRPRPIRIAGSSSPPTRSSGPGVQNDGEETILVMRDVTDARRREAIRETFVGVLSHELRTPVTTIYGGAKLLAREGLDARRGDSSERVRRHHGGDRASASTGRGRRRPEPVRRPAGDIGAEPVLLQRLLPRVVSSEEGRWPGVTFRLEIEPNLPTVVADPTYVEQVFRNLLSNAAKYGGVGHRRSRSSPTTGDDEVTVRILDDGPGLLGRGDRSPVRAVLPLARDRPDRQRGGIGLFVSRSPDRGDGRSDLGSSSARGWLRIRVRAAGAARLIERPHRRSVTASHASARRRGSPTAIAPMAAITTKKQDELVEEPDLEVHAHHAGEDHRRQQDRREDRQGLHDVVRSLREATHVDVVRAEQRLAQVLHRIEGTLETAEQLRPRTPELLVDGQVRSARAGRRPPVAVPATGGPPRSGAAGPRVRPRTSSVARPRSAISSSRSISRSNASTVRW